jgi:hypothetical protein
MSALGQKQTCAVQPPMSAIGQKRTLALRQTTSLFDHFVGAKKYTGWDSKPER